MAGLRTTVLERNTERDQARTDLTAAQAAHRAELQVLQRERDAARVVEIEQRERAVRAEQAAQVAE